MLGFKQLTILTGLFVILCLISAYFIDYQVVSLVNSEARPLQPVVAQLTSYTDIVTGYTVSKYLVGGLALIGGIVLLAMDKTMNRAKYLFFIALTSLASSYATGPLKTVFGRARPSTIVDSQQIDPAIWFVGGDSFPSGHVGRYFGIFLPLAVVLPRYRLALLVVPIYISMGRIILNVHFLSDVFASIYIVIVCSSLFAYLLKINPVAAPHSTGDTKAGDD